MPFDDLFQKGKNQIRCRHTGPTMQRLKDDEKLLGVFQVDPDPII
jgi:hypothetical protein